MSSTGSFSVGWKLVAHSLLSIITARLLLKLVSVHITCSYKYINIIVWIYKYV